jgi:ADP-heptose:LPS heptosyltransferase
MNKNLSIFGVVRPSLIGDCVLSTVFLNYLEKIYPNSYKCAYIDKKCNQIVPLLTNHPLIDKVQVSELKDQISDNDANFINKFDLKFHPFPQHWRQNDWYNHHNIIDETLSMNFLIGKGYMEPSQFDILTKEEKCPRLYQWFDTERQNKTIAIWAKSGYGNQDQTIDLRSPKTEWWGELCLNLNKMGYKCLLFGHPKSDYIENTIDYRNLSLFDAVKVSLGCDTVIGTDSGTSWIIGAYGHSQIILYTNYKKDHITNTKAFCPINYKNNSIDIYGENGNINNITIEEVLQQIK